mgnify:CR=1 FL=1
MFRRDLFIGAATVLTSVCPAAPGRAERPNLAVYRTRDCGCCPGWVTHLRQAGFAVRVTELPQIDSVQRTAGVPPELAGCSIALHEGFSFSGHVPAAAIRRFLADPGMWRGLAVPETPPGPPGTEAGGRDPQTYDIYAFSRDGRRESFARARGRDLV